MNAADAMYAGFADSFIAEDIWDEVIAKLVSAGTPDPLSSFIDDAGSSQLATMQTEIDQMFTNFNSDKMATEQAKSTGELTEIITSALAKNAPLSMMAVDAMLTRLGPDCTFQRALEMEYRFTSRAMQQGEFLEGTRAMLIDKDRKPDWQYKTASELPEGLIDEMLAPTAFTQAFLATGDGL
jgi:3-hydroxyisobutyrate dehydrogenase